MAGYGINYDEAQMVMGRFVSIDEQLAEAQTRVKNIVDALGDVWKNSKGREDYVELQNQWSGTLTQMSLLLQKMNQCLGMNLENYHGTDEYVGKLMRG
ncbi:WXG100 family type VII secretion target [Streptomyces sp. NPDC054841]